MFKIAQIYGQFKNNNIKRIKYIDIARGIAIILMIAGHVCTHGWKRSIIFSFHMPLFIIISGMFFSENENFKELIIKMLKKLIIPYIFTILFTQILRVLIYNQQWNTLNVFKQIIFAYSNGKTFFKDIPGVVVLWFIPFLVASKIIFYLINKISKDDDVLKGIICLLCTIIGIYLAKIKIFLPWSFDIVFSSTIFYYTGYILKKYNMLNKILTNYKIMTCILLVYYFGLKFGYIELAIRQYPYGIIAYITAISGTLIVLELSKIIENILKYFPNVLAWFGKNSMYVLCFHYLESNIINYTKLGITNKYLNFGSKLIIITILTFILTKIIKVLKQKKNNELYELVDNKQ